MTIAQDLGIDREALRKLLFASSADGERPPILACACGTRDLKEVLAEILPATGYRGSVGSFVDYWFAKDSNVNRDLFAVVERLARHAHMFDTVADVVGHPRLRNLL
jgi:putative hydrolase of the HAD superfamily